jgi:hypothetical protein
MSRHSPSSALRAGVVFPAPPRRPFPCARTQRIAASNPGCPLRVTLSSALHPWGPARPAARPPRLRLSRLWKQLWLSAPPAANGQYCQRARPTGLVQIPATVASPPTRPAAAAPAAASRRPAASRARRCWVCPQPPSSWSPAMAAAQRLAHSLGDGGRAASSGKADMFTRSYSMCPAARCGACESTLHPAWTRHRWLRGSAEG